MKRSLKVLAILLVTILIGVGCSTGSKTPAEKPQEKSQSQQPAQQPATGQTPATSSQAAAQRTPEVVRIGAAAMGGNYFIAGGALGTVLNKKGGMQTSVMVTGGGRNNAILANDGKIDIGFTNTIEVREEWDKNNRKNVRSLFPAFSGLLHFVVNGNLPINTIYDLKDYAISLGPAGSTHNAAGRGILDILGIKPKQIQNISFEDSANLMKDGQLAGLFIATSPPAPVVAELKATHNVKILSMTDQDMDKVIAANPAYSKGVIPANTYKDQPQEIKVLSSWNIGITNKDVSEEWVYKVMDLVYKNKSDLVAAMVGFKELDPKFIGSLAIPLHVGAVKWYKDNGVEVPKALIPPECKE